MYKILVLCAALAIAKAGLIASPPLSYGHHPAIYSHEPPVSYGGPGLAFDHTIYGGPGFNLGGPTVSYRGVPTFVDSAQDYFGPGFNLGPTHGPKYDW